MCKWLKGASDNPSTSSRLGVNAICTDTSALDSGERGKASDANVPWATVAGPAGRPTGS